MRILDVSTFEHCLTKWLFSFCRILSHKGGCDATLMILLWLESKIFEANKVNDPYTRNTIFGQTFAVNVLIFIFKRTTRPITGADAIQLGKLNSGYLFATHLTAKNTNVTEMKNLE